MSDTKFPEGEHVVAITTTNYGTLYVATTAVYRIDLRASGREMEPVKIKAAT